MSLKKIVARSIRGGAILFQLLLLAVLGLQGFLVYCLIAFGHIPVPTATANEWLRGHSLKDYYLQGQSYQLDLNGTLHVYEAALHRHDLAAPIVQAQRLDLQFSPRSKSLKHLALYQGTLIQPAPYSSDGQRHEILGDIGLDLALQSGGAVLNLKAFTAQYGPLRILASALIDRAHLPTIKTSSAASTDPLESLFELLQNNRERDVFLKATEAPLLSLSLREQSTTEALKLAVFFEAQSLTHNALAIEAIQIHALADVNGANIAHSEALHFKASSLIYEQAHRFHIKNPNGTILTKEALALAKGQWPNCQIYADEVSTFGKSVDAAALQLSRAGPQSVQLITLGNGFGGPLAFKGSLNTEDFSGSGTLLGALNPQMLLSDEAVKKLPQLQLSGPSHCRVQLDWGPQFEEPEAHAFAHFIRPQLNGVHFEIVSLNARLDSENLEINPLRFKRGTQSLELHFFQNFESQSYGLTTKGRLIPKQYNPFMPRWWSGIFNEAITFNPHSWVEGDCVVYGDTPKYTTNFYYGQFEGGNLAYRDVPIDSGRLTLRGRNRYAEIHKLHAQSNSHWIKGDIHFTGYPDEIRASAGIRYDLEGKLPLVELRKLLPPQTAKNLDPFETAQAPSLRLQATQFREKDYPQFQGLSHLELDVDASKPLEFNDLPLQYLRFKLYARDKRLSLRKLDFGIAEGVGTGAIDRFEVPFGGDPWLRLELQVNDAEYDRARALLNAFKNKTPKAPATDRPTPNEKGLINLNLRSEGPANDLEKHSGFGHFTLDHDNLATIQLLGPFSMILEKTPLGFTSLKLNRMESEFAIADGYLKFSPLNINGPQTSIEANGTLKLSDQALDLLVGVNLIGNLEQKINPFKPITDILNPLTYLMQFRITGTVEEQQIRSLYDPRNLLP